MQKWAAEVVRTSKVLPPVLGAKEFIKAEKTKNPTQVDVCG